MDNGVRRGSLIRSSLKRLENQLQEKLTVGAGHAGDFQPPLLRCHRSYIVNLSRVRTCQGNRHGLKLALVGAEKSIPVSRAYYGAIVAGN
jgi:hypothetical protein